MSEPALVTVCVLSCNRSQYLGQALESVRAQSFRNWRLIVSDCSDDKQAAASIRKIVWEFADREGARVEFLKQPTRIPQSEHLRRVLAAADTRYVALLDDDDYWEDSHLDRSIAALEADPLLGVTVSNGRVITSDGSSPGTTNEPDFPFPSAEQTSKWLALFLRSFYGSTSSYVIRREALASHVFTETSCVDIHMAISVLLSGFRVKAYGEPSYCYRVHADSFYAKGHQVVLDRHRLRIWLLAHQFLPLTLKCPVFPLLAAKSGIELLLHAVRRR